MGQETKPRQMYQWLREQRWNLAGWPFSTKMRFVLVHTLHQLLWRSSVWRCHYLWNGSPYCSSLRQGSSVKVLNLGEALLLELCGRDNDCRQQPPYHVIPCSSSGLLFACNNIPGLHKLPFLVSVLAKTWLSQLSCPLDKDRRVNYLVLAL